MAPALSTKVQAAVTAEAAGVGPDQLALARIARLRREAAERVTRDRDYIRLRAEMDRLDVEEVTARVATRAAICAREVEEYLADLPGLYDSAEPSTQKRILQALFERVEVLGPNQLWLVPSAEAEARGLGPLFTGAFRTKVRQSGRGEEGLAPSIPTSVSTSSGSCRIGRDRSFCRLIVRHRDYPCVDHRYRRSRHAPMTRSSALSRMATSRRSSTP